MGQMIPKMLLPDILPLFPLAGAILLPRAQLPLNIFEPRYLAMVRSAHAGNGLIGMIQPMEETSNPKPDLFRIGCVGHITSYETLKDGRVALTLTGVSRFEISSELEVNTLYRQVTVDYGRFASDQEPSQDLPPALRQQLVNQLSRFLKTRDLKADWSAVSTASDEILVNALTMLLPFALGEKQALVEAMTLEDRANALVVLMSFAEPDEYTAPEVRH